MNTALNTAIRTNYTFEEYLAFEENASERHEYHNGQIFAMAGGTGDHSLIAGSINTALDNAIDREGKHCVVFNSDMKVRVEKYNKGVYPDLTAVCGDIEYFNEKRTVLQNPILFIEVLSESTKEYDKSEKFEMYRSIPSFQEYMVVYQSIPRVQTWYKETDELWRISSAQGLDQSIQLYSIGCSLALADIYKRVLKNLKDIPEDLSLAY